MMVTEHFDSEEFDQHDGTPYPPEWIETRLRPLCDVLESIRGEAGGPITIKSGYRTVEYNQAIYAAANEPPTDSEHSRGRAADISCPSMKASELHALIYRLQQDGTIRIGGLGKYNTFVHVDVRPWIGHLAQWDKSTESGSPNSGPDTGAAEGSAEEDEDAVSSWIAPMALVAAVAFLIYLRYG